jgi:hypothetical protein
MSGHHYTPAEYTLQQAVECRSNLFVQLEELRLFHINRVVFHSCESDNIGCLVLRYLNTGALPFQEVSQNWLYDDEAQSLST